WVVGRPCRPLGPACCFGRDHTSPDEVDLPFHSPVVAPHREEAGRELLRASRVLGGSAKNRSPFVSRPAPPTDASCPFARSTVHPWVSSSPSERSGGSTVG